MTIDSKPTGGGPAADDTSELAKFGYRQELERSLGSFSSFAAGFSYISILTGVFQLFFFGFGSGGPAFIWTWPLVFLGQLAVALCFSELAGQFPLAGSVYQWAKQIAKPATSWLAGWIMIIGAIVLRRRGRARCECPADHRAGHPHQARPAAGVRHARRR